MERSWLTVQGHSYPGSKASEEIEYMPMWQIYQEHHRCIPFHRNLKGNVNEVRAHDEWILLQDPVKHVLPSSSGEAKLQNVRPPCQSCQDNFQSRS
jgi:hypothetical protein